MEYYYKEKEEIKEEHTKEVNSVKEERKTAAITEEDKIIEKEVEETLNLNEAETRKKLIDIMLKDAGWDIENNELVKLELLLKNHKETGKNGYADYVLFNKKGNSLAVVEAKKSSVDPIIGRQQAVEYANTVERDYGIRPIVFYTNGYEIYMWDDKYSEPRQIWGFYTLEDLEELFFKHKYKKDLNKVEIDKSIAGRPYQIEGIKRVYERYSNGHRKALLVMATGTGKTRTVIALTKGMMEASYAKRVLFLADRDELVRQAKEDKNSFKTFMPEQISCRFTGKNSENRESTLYFSTYQTMINYYSKFSIGFFDLIICDESHRSIYKTYRDILEYFDSYIIGLTATPVDFIERNTFDLFNCDAEDPTFNFSVEDAWNHIPPYLIEPRVIDATTDFLRKGIKYSHMTEEQRQQVDDEGYDGDEFEFDKKELEKRITNKDTNKFILKTLMDNGLKVGDHLGKTIIFAKSKNHANLLDSLFNEMYPQYKGKMTAVIYSGIKDKERLIEDFKNENFPRIAISLDLLDTGVDVPEIVNLVFAKPIYSKVKFWQMIGRGTRRCDNLFGDGIDKSKFIEMFGNTYNNSKGWIVEEISKSLINIENGKSFVCENYSRNGDYPAILKLSAVTYGVYNPTENKALTDKGLFVESVEVKKDDLLFTRKNTPELGMSAYVYETSLNLMMPDLIFRLNTNEICNKIYLWQLINHSLFRENIKALSNGSAKSMSNISKQRLMSLKIPVPPIDLQNQFANFVAQVNKLKDEMEKSLKELENNFNSLMQRAFIGELF